MDSTPSLHGSWILQLVLWDDCSISWAIGPSSGPCVWEPDVSMEIVGIPAACNSDPEPIRLELTFALTS